MTETLHTSLSERIKVAPEVLSLEPGRPELHHVVCYWTFSVRWSYDAADQSGRLALLSKMVTLFTIPSVLLEDFLSKRSYFLD